MTFFLITSWAEGQLEQIAKKKWLKLMNLYFLLFKMNRYEFIFFFKGNQFQVMDQNRNCSSNFFFLYFELFCLHTNFIQNYCVLNWVMLLPPVPFQPWFFLCKANANCYCKEFQLVSALKLPNISCIMLIWYWYASICIDDCMISVNK